MLAHGQQLANHIGAFWRCAAVLALDLSLLFQVLGRICSTPNRFRMGAECLSTSLNTPATSENRVTARSEPVTQCSKKLTKGSKDGEVMSVL